MHLFVIVMNSIKLCILKVCIKMIEWQLPIIIVIEVKLELVMEDK